MSTPQRSPDKERVVTGVFTSRQPPGSGEEVRGGGSMKPLPMEGLQPQVVHKYTLQGYLLPACLNAPVLLQGPDRDITYLIQGVQCHV